MIGSIQHYHSSNRKSLKEALMNKQRSKCKWCKDVKKREELSIVKNDENGTNQFYNLMLLCQCCRKIKEAAKFNNYPFREAFRKLYESKK